MTVAVATCAEHPDLPEGERSVLARLRELGVAAQPAVWDSPAVDWTAFAAVVLRAAWDYHLKSAAFAAWLERLESSGVPLWNPASVVRGNMVKTYLRDLEQAGVPVVPTAWLAPGGGRALDEILSERGWARAVVGRSSRRAPTGRAASLAARRERRRRWTRFSRIPTRWFSPFFPRSRPKGNGPSFSWTAPSPDAVLKKPAPGDFRVQSEHGGAAERREPPPELLAQAEAAAAIGAKGLLYARVDGVRRGRDLLLVELELIEPYLYLDEAPGAAGRLARGIASRVSNLRRHKT